MKILYAAIVAVMLAGAAANAAVDPEATSPLRYERAFQKGEAEFAAGRYDAALQHFDAIPARRLAPRTQWRLDMLRGYCLLLRRDYAAAQACFDAVADRPEYATAARFYQGYIAYCQERYDAAQQLLAPLEYAVTAPADATPYLLMEIALQQGRYERAATLARQLIAAPRYPQYSTECLRVAGEALYAAGKERDAIPHLLQYVSQTEHPSPNALYILAEDSYNGGRYAEALQYLQPVTAANTLLAQNAYLLIGQTYTQLADNDAASLAFERAWRLGAHRAVTETAMYNYLVGRTRGARVPFAGEAPLFEQFLADFPESVHVPDVSLYLVDGYLAAGDYAGALRALDSRRAADTPHTLAARRRALFMLGVKAYEAGQYAEAARLFNEVTRLTDNADGLTPQAWLRLGDARLAQEDRAGAATAYRRALSLRPSAQMTAWANYGLGYALLPDNAEGALAAFRAAGSDMPWSADADTRIADLNMLRALNLQGTAAERLAALETAMAQYPATALTATALLRRAELLNALGRTDDAIDAYNLLIATLPESAEARNATLQLALAYRAAGRDDDARALYEDIIAENPADDEALLAATDLERIHIDDMLARADEAARQGRALGAYETYTQASALADDPVQRTAARRGALLAAATLGRHDEVITLADTLLQADGSDAEVRFLRATSAEALGRYELSDDEFTQLAANPRSIWGARAAIALGESLLRRDGLKSARAVVDDFINAEPPHPYWLARAFILYSDILRRQGNTFEADEYLRSLRDNYPGTEADIQQMINERLQ